MSEGFVAVMIVLVGGYFFTAGLTFRLYKTHDPLGGLADPFIYSVWWPISLPIWLGDYVGRCFFK